MTGRRGFCSQWPPPPRRSPLDIYVAASYTLTEHSLLLKTVKLGLLARIASVNRVSRLILYIDRGEAEPEARLARVILGYALTAPYLRRRLYPRRPELRYAGVLPPLQLPTHGAGGPAPGEVREALVLGCRGDVVVLEAGLGAPVEAKAPGARLRPGSRIFIRLASLRPLRVEVVEKPPVYTGFRVEVAPSLREAMRDAARRGRVVVATSRLGEQASWGLLRRLPRIGRGLAVFFGAPDRGLYEIARREGFSLEDEASYVLNTVPCQGTRTVRVEEAVAATLALLNLALGEQG